MKKFIKLAILVTLVLIFSGCSGMYYNHPSKSEPHAILELIKDDKHKFSIFGDSTIFIYRINGKDVNDMWKARNATRTIAPGKTTIYIQEDKMESEFIFEGTFTINAIDGEKYIISSIHKIENGRIVDIEFFILNQNKIIQKIKSEKIKRGQPLYIPIFI